MQMLVCVFVYAQAQTIESTSPQLACGCAPPKFFFESIYKNMYQIPHRKLVKIGAKKYIGPTKESVPEFVPQFVRQSVLQNHTVKHS